MLLNYGQMFTILPFGNATVVGTMTGAADHGRAQPERYPGQGRDPAGRASLQVLSLLGSQCPARALAWAWGAFDACVINKTTHVCDPLDMAKTYKVGTNEFLAPAGGDNYAGFKYMTNITYWGDMLNAVNAWVTANYTPANPYKGPKGDGTLDGRITRDGTDTGGSIVPVTILHHNDSHGRLAQDRHDTSGSTPNWLPLIKQERFTTRAAPCCSPWAITSRATR